MATVVHQAPQQQYLSHFCKDCGVMFESATSLEVHLSYHKENLISRWGQGSSPSGASDHHKSPAGSPQLDPQHHQPQQQSQLHQQQFVQMEPPPQYLYNNNTGDHLRFQGDFHAEFHPQFHHFPPPPEIPVSGTPSAEILDLDSHKVHIYQHQQQQQQGFFHRPYLQHLLPPQANNPNGLPPWNSFYQPQIPPQPPTSVQQSQQPQQVSQPQQQQLQETPTQFYQQQPTPTTQANGLSPNEDVYEMIGRGDTPLPPFSVASAEFSAQPTFATSQGQGQPSPFGGIKMEGQQPPPPPSTGKPPKVSPSNGPGKKSPEVLSGPPPPKTKGWKGGECKRPKTYNCPACNKWFTSSGHLKRHYGTTLHKNSMKQLGDSAEELFKNQPKGRKGSKGPGPIPDSMKSNKNRSSPKHEDLASNSDQPQQPQPKLQPFAHQPQTQGPPGQAPELPHALNINNNGPQPHSPKYPQFNFSYPIPQIGFPPQTQASTGPFPDFSAHFQSQNGGFVAQHQHPVQSQNGGGDNGGPLPPFSAVGGMSHYERTEEFAQQQQHGIQQQPQTVGSSSSGSSESGSESESAAGGKEVLKCPDCSKTFQRSCYLTQHANSSHSGGKPFKCSQCGKRFPGAPALNDHLAKHGGDKPYKCDLCPKQFNHKTDLRRHLCLHTGEKPFVCTACGKGFIRKDHMTKHLETHQRRKASNSKKAFDDDSPASA